MPVEAEYGLPKRVTKADLNSRHSVVSGIGLSQPVSKLDTVGNGGTSFLRVTQLADEYNFPGVIVYLSTGVGKRVSGRT